MINGLAKYTKQDGQRYCKGNQCASCKLKNEICINESGDIRIKNHTDYEDFQRSFNKMIVEIMTHLYKKDDFSGNE